MVDADAGEAFDSMLHRDARFWDDIAARKVRLPNMPIYTVRRSSTLFDCDVLVAKELSSTPKWRVRDSPPSMACES